MSTSVSLGFAIGILAASTSCALPFALAALGLRAAGVGGADERGMRGALGSAAARGAIASVAFAALLLTAFVLEEAGAEVSDLVPVAALALGLAVVALAVRALATPSAGAGARAPAAALFGLAYAIASLPCALALVDGLVELTTESRGTAGAVASLVLFFAGAFAALIALSLAAELCAVAARGLGATGRALGALLAAAAGVVSALYWLPAVVDGVAERGGAVGDAASEVAGAFGRFAATYTLAFALVLLCAALAALASELRRPARP